jgi:hypothetical protein
MVGSQPWRSRALSEPESAERSGAGFSDVWSFWGEQCIHDGLGHQVINGTRGPLGPHFGSDTKQGTIGKSNYNALQLSLRHTSGRLELSAGYTYGKSLDESSNLGEEVNPVNPALSYALSSFDLRHNFVVSYNYKIPFEKLLRVSNRWTQGWESPESRISVPATRDSNQLLVTILCSGPSRTASTTMALMNRIIREALLI